ncbi:MAG TPA: glutamate synthase large subunit [Sandaracinaceae bacterium LLY-WYZ-13_1]|nr:glutamate synthase large subunit [Sandaracinaceae bacterium LLY-WYZ-13_1]
MPHVSFPQRRDASERGLYRADLEHDSCGVGFIAHMRGERSHGLIEKALEILENLEHRGAEGSDPLTGDGAGLLLQVPHELFRAEAKRNGFALPRRAGAYGVGMVFLPSDEELRTRCEQMIEEIVADEEQDLLGWRDVPVDTSVCGPNALETIPAIRQFFVGPGTLAADPSALGRKLYVIRKRVDNEARNRGLQEEEYPFVCSLSRRTIVYKGLLTPEQLPRFYRDLADERMKTGLALVHQRFSTNTFPSWSRAHPYRRIAHNGEINTLRGNVNWMRAREPVLMSPVFGEDVDKIRPVIDPRGSDSAMFDDVLELLVHTGRSLPHAIMMMIPEAWQKHEAMPEERRAFYEYHSCVMEPWDGPACIAFTDGRLVGAVLDRNGLRPARYTVTKDDLVIMASEAGVLDVPPNEVRAKNRLQPGRMFLVDTLSGTIVDDEIIKEEESSRRPWQRWLDESIVTMGEVPPAPSGSIMPPMDDGSLRRAQKAQGYTMEDLRILMAPMAKNAKEGTGSMGNDTPLAVLSERPQPLFNYFKQLFAQVTNPPIDPIREELVMTLRTTLGAESNLFEESPTHCRKLQLHSPILGNEELEQIRALDRPGLRAETLQAVFDPKAGPAGLEMALERLCRDAEQAVQAGATLLVVSDRGLSADRAPIPSLLATGAVHHHLIRAGLRKAAGLIVETGEAREVMHFCLLIGYGAGGVNPYLAYETLGAMARAGELDGKDEEQARLAYVKAVEKGILKVMSKMGISTLQSYRGAQIFEAVGLSERFVDRFFTGTPTHLDGVGLETVAEEAIARHRGAFSKVHLDVLTDELDPGGSYQFRRRGEHHMWNPSTIGALQHAVRSGDYGLYEKFTRRADAEARRDTIRGLLDFRTEDVTPIDLDEVEPAHEIVKRFKTGAMSFGSISKEAHETLAVAMNRIGARSNSGEGGEDPARFVRDENGDWRRSAIKQVASGRFGVTIEYLNEAEEIQIKIAQGAKPGEGGQLPGHKVDDNIARVRHSTPGVGLISPPPHHDIYSIEDLAQLIHDLKNANPDARVTVKLVSEVGVGTIAAGVAKAKADVILISGGSGGTGASPLTSIKHAGSPWEIGLAETQQTLVLNDLRGRVKLETDGQLKTGRDVAIAAMLGAEEFGFGSISLITMGCIMMRVCHLNTCPVGVATQDPRLRERFAGQPEHVIHFMTFVARQLREIMASLGIRTVDELVGRTDLLKPREDLEHPKAKQLNLSKLLYRPDVEHPIRNVQWQDHELELAMDTVLLEQARPALEKGEPVEIQMPIRNVHRTACTMLSSRVAKKYGIEGLPDATIRIRFDGSAGQSFAAFLANGLDVTLVGDANDYFGKGMSGGRAVVFPPEGSDFPPEENIIIGNVALYGATAGEVFIRGMAGERFGVRNSGARAVVEGVGDHGCEYMTGGRVICLGPTGRNFAAGMSGGIAYVLDTDASFERHVNKEMVDLEPLTSEDLAFVRSMVHRHYERTMSALAWRVLSGWKKESRRFVKVMPREYRRVLDERRGAAKTA